MQIRKKKDQMLLVIKCYPINKLYNLNETSDQKFKVGKIKLQRFLMFESEISQSKKNKIINYIIQTIVITLTLISEYTPPYGGPYMYSVLLIAFEISIKDCSTVEQQMLSAPYLVFLLFTKEDVIRLKTVEKYKNSHAQQAQQRILLLQLIVFMNNHQHEPGFVYNNWIFHTFL